MIQQYNILKANKWLQKNTGQAHVDQHGNEIWYLEIAGHAGKKIRAARKPGNDAATGEQWGELNFYEDGNGRFSYKRPPEQTAPVSYSKPSGGYSKDDNAIQAMWAIKTAVQAGFKKEDEIEEFARTLFEMVSRVKGVTLEDAIDALGGEEVELPPVEVYDNQGLTDEETAEIPF